MGELMPKIAYVADVHVGNFRRFGGEQVRGINDRCRRVLDVLTKSRERAAELGCDAFVICGDLFDSDKPTPQIEAAVQDAIGLGLDDDMQRIVLNGNHDQHTAEKGDNALAPLRLHATIVEEVSCLDVLGVHLVCVPYATGVASEWFGDAVAGVVPPFGARQGPVVLAMHLGVSDSKTAPWLRTAGDAVTAELCAQVCDDLGISHAFAGNWHDARTWDLDGVRIEQCGALVPTGFNNPGADAGMYGQLVVHDTDTGKVERYEIPGPRFILARAGTWDLDDQAAPIIDARGRGCDMYLDMTVPADELAAARERMSAGVSLGQWVAVDVKPDGADAEAAARQAAAAAKSATRLSDSLAAFVERMPLDDDVDRQRVLDLARRYLRVG